jgi:hypothetical protein
VIVQPNKQNQIFRNSKFLKKTDKDGEAENQDNLK